MPEIQPPSLRLPPLRGLATLSPAILIDCVEYLTLLCTPEVRGSRILRRIFPDSTSPATSATSQPAPDIQRREQIAALRSDDFERAYTIRWLTYLINNADRFQAPPSDFDTVVDRAAALLANCGGPASAGIISRIFEFPSTRGSIRVTLRDIPLENGDFSSVGAQTWGGACVLAEIIAAQPSDFGLLDRPAPLRVLELGAGTGLVGISLAKAAEQVDGTVNIVCSDFYPSVLQNLALNIATNFPATERTIEAHFLDWSSFMEATPAPRLPPFDAPFEVILGADIVYEPTHAAWIHSCVSQLLDTTPASQFHLVIPLRPTHAQESNSVETVFQSDGSTPALIILSKEIIVCSVEGSASEEVEYAYYRIGWSRKA
ncbi:putative methyltransferase-domain-containing protein [Mycena maculata]|uniref:Methyltransferase-domain-containing protein n=1 Tax=Mycena maculata TaxID=230809 RepID=A0AAD7HTY6_9AGAR|nr:putative methyltransferase-domain-containing protein [Mycena maculata]